MARIIESSAPEASTSGSNPQPADPASLSEKAATLIEVQTARSEARKRYSIKVAAADAEISSTTRPTASPRSSKVLRHQVKVKPEHVRWLQANLEKGRSELLDPIVVAVSPSNLTASGQADIQLGTESTLSVTQYAMRLTKAIADKVEHGAPRSAPYSGTPTPARFAGNLPVEFLLRTP
ncbi:hypothetical protein A4X09_0g7715, partial [Tilletia walkeri]